MLRHIPIRILFAAFLFLLCSMIVMSISVGPMNISFSHALQSSIERLFPTAIMPTMNQLPVHVELIIQQVRLPRTLLCLFIGAILELCGAVMQGLFRNPLAEPSIIGVSSGAALGAAFAIVCFAGLKQDYPLFMDLAAVPVFAFLGGALTTIMIYKLGTSQFGTSVTVMLLAGVANKPCPTQ